MVKFSPLVEIEQVMLPKDRQPFEIELQPYERGACVAVAGIIGFVGLLIPHMMRFATGPDNRKLIPVSLLAGAVLLLIADTVTRAVLPAEIPIGVLTALIGGPFFCYIFRKRQVSGGK